MVYWFESVANTSLKIVIIKAFIFASNLIIVTYRFQIAGASAGAMAAAALIGEVPLVEVAWEVLK